MIRGLTQLRGDASRSDIVGVKLVCRHLQEQISNVHQVCQQMADLQREHLQELKPVGRSSCGRTTSSGLQLRELLQDELVKSGRCSDDGDVLRI